MASLEGAVKFALAWEERARDTYLKWSGKSNNPTARALFKNLSRMEEEHITLLKGIDLTDLSEVNVPHIDWVSLAEGVVSHSTAGDSELKAIFEYAMNKEEGAHERYTKLAESLPEGETRNLFRRLAAEEKQHRNLIREEYHHLFNPA